MLSDVAKRVIDELPVDQDIQNGLMLLIYDQELLHATLAGLVSHWREFGPEYGFDELLEEAANRHGI